MKKSLGVILITGLLLSAVGFSVLAKEAEDADYRFAGRVRLNRNESWLQNLKLMAEQQQQLLSIRQEFQKDTQPLRFKKQQLQLELRQLWTAKPLDQKTIETKAGQLAGLKVQLIEKSRAMKEKINQVLTEEQIKQLHELKQNRGCPRPDRIDKGKGHRGNFASDLGLTAQQQQQLLQIRQGFQKDILALRHSLQQKQLELRQLWQAEKLDQKRIEVKTKEVTALRVQLAVKSGQMQEKLKSVLTEEQLTKLKERPLRPQRPTRRERL